MKGISQKTIVIFALAIINLRKILEEWKEFFRQFSIFNFQFSIYTPSHAYSAIPTTALRTSNSTGLCL